MAVNASEKHLNNHVCAPSPPQTGHQSRGRISVRPPLTKRGNPSTSRHIQRHTWLRAPSTHKSAPESILKAAVSLQKHGPRQLQRREAKIKLGGWRPQKRRTSPSVEQPTHTCRAPYGTQSLRCSRVPLEKLHEPRA